MRLQKLNGGAVRLSQLNPWEVRTLRNLPNLADFSGHDGAERRLLPSPAVEADLTPEMGMDWVEFVVPELRESFARNLGAVMADLESLRLQETSPEDEAPAELPAEAAAEEGADSTDQSDPPDQSDPTDPTAGKTEDKVSQNKSPEPKTTAEEKGEPPAQPESLERKQASEGGEPEALPASPEFKPAPAPAPAPELYTLEIPAEHAELWFRAMNQARLVLSAKHGIDSEHLPDLASLLSSGKLEHWFQYELFVSLQGWLMDAVIDP